MFRKVNRARFLGILLLLGSLLWIVNNRWKSEQPVTPKAQIISTVKHEKLPRMSIKKKLNPLSVQLDVIEDGSKESEKIIQSKPKVSLPIPANIEHSVGSNEWISRTIYDSKSQCSPVLKQNQNDDKPRSNMSCQIPNLDPFNPTIMGFMKKTSTASCSHHRSCGKLVDGIIEFTDSTVVSATYKGISRRGDFNYVLGTRTPVSRTKRITDEFIEVDYLIRNGHHIKEYYLQPVPHEHLRKRSAIKQPGMPLNILIVGMDSLSHANAIRKLPEFYEFLKKDLGAFIFNGHSIVGDGTTEQLAAMLTGQGELEQYESRRHHRNPRPVDGWTWIYKQLKEHGYLTGYSGDAPHIGPFQYRLLGFKDQPTDFYPRPFYQKVNRLRQGENLCLGSKNIAQHQFKYIRDVFDMFPEKLKFLFSFNVLFSHDDLNKISKIEPDLLSLVQDLKRKEHLNNTLLIVMGDHGNRYGKMRAQIQGKLEERLPLFAMVFPPWFSSHYPTIAENLRRNTDRLTSWYDVYATYRHMLSYPELPSRLKHGQSLLQEVPVTRTCKQANVDQHWCPCQKWSAVDITGSHVQNAALAAVEYINSLNEEHGKSVKYCEILSLKAVNYAMVERPNDKVLSFHKTNDLIPEFNARARPTHTTFCRYQLQLQTSPNNGVYEATVRYHMNWFIVSKSISRVDQYGDQPECIARDLPHLRKFCLCKKLVNATEPSN